MHDIPKPTPEELSAYLDGELDPTRRAEISYYITTDQRLSEYVASQRAIQDGLRALEGQADQLHVPSEAAVGIATSPSPVQAKLRRWFLPLIFALGGAAMATALLFLVRVPEPVGEQSGQSWVAADTAFFLEEGAHSFEFVPEDSASINRILPAYPVAARLSPAIQSAGFSLKGGRVMTFQGAGAILLVYEDRNGDPLGLMIWRTTAEPMVVVPMRPKGVETILWTDGPFSFALTGSQGVDVLTKFRVAYQSR